MADPTETTTERPSFTPRPTMGRIVFFRYVDDDDGDRAAVINAVHRDGTVDVTVFLQREDGASANTFCHVEFDDDDDEPARHTWRWPPRV